MMAAGEPVHTAPTAVKMTNVNPLQLATAMMATFSV